MLLMLCCYFNSIKVQLEHYFTGVLPTSQLFQFHKGTIRTGKAENEYEQGLISIP